MSVIDKYPSLNKFKQDMARLHNDLFETKGLSKEKYGATIEGIIKAISENLSFSVDSVFDDTGIGDISVTLTDGSTHKFRDVFSEIIVDSCIDFYNSDVKLAKSKYAGIFISSIEGGEYELESGDITYCFDGCGLLKTVGNKNSDGTINYFTFNNATSWSYMFRNCASLTELYINPNIWNGLGLSGCTNLRKIYIGRQLTQSSRVDNNAWAGTSGENIEEIHGFVNTWKVPKNIKKITFFDGGNIRFTTGTSEASADFYVMDDVSEIYNVANHLEVNNGTIAGANATIRFRKWNEVPSEDQTAIDDIIQSKGWRRLE